MSDETMNEAPDDPAWLLASAGKLRREGRADLSNAVLDRCRTIAQARDDARLLDAIARLEGDGGVSLVPAPPLQTSLALFDQSRDSLVRGDLAVASIGFAAGHALASTLEPEGHELSVYLAVGLMTAQAASGNADAAMATGARLLGIESDSESDELDTTSSLLDAALTAGSDGDHETAERLYLQLQEMLEAQPPYPGSEIDRANVVMNRGINFDASGELLQAEACFAEAQGLLDQVPLMGEDLAYQGLLHMNRAVTLCSLGRHDESERLAAAAQEIFDGLTESYSSRRHAAVVRTQRGDNFRKQGRLLRADEQYAAAAVFFANLSNDERNGLRFDLANLSLGRANNTLARGRYAEAETLLATTAALYDKLPDGPSKHYMLAGIHLNRGVAAQRQGQHPQAEALYRQAQELFDHVRVSEHVRAQQATVRMNRGDNLETMGLWDEADRCHAQAQALFDQLLDRDQARVGGASVRINRSNTLQSRGRHDEAEVLYAEIDDLLADLPSSLENIEALTLASQNHAINLQALGRYEAADDLFRSALQRLQGLDETDAVHAMRATVLSNFANNANFLGRHAEAEQHFALAQDLFDALPDSESSSKSRTLVRVNRLTNLLARRDMDAASVLWPSCFERLQTLQGHSNPALPEAAAVMMQALIELVDANIYPADLGEQHAYALCRWSLDWIDIVSDPLAPVPPGAEHVAATFGLALGWMMQSGRTDCIADLLSEQFGRFAAAERLAGEEAIHGITDLHPVARLRQSVRRLNGELQALESSLSDTPPGDDEPRAMRSLRARRDVEVNALRAALRIYRQSDDAVTTTPMDRLAQAVRCTSDGTRRALVVLFRYLVNVEDPSSPRPASHAQAAALIVMAGGQPPQLVSLPDLVLDVALNGRKTGKHPSQVRPVSAPTAMTASARASGAHAPVLDADGWSLLQAVLAGKEALWPALGDVDEVFIATHHELGHLPWQGLHDRRPVRVFHGVQLAVQALERVQPTMRIAPPDTKRKLGVLAHSPEPTPAPGSIVGASGAWRHSIPGVYADQTVTRLLWPTASELLHGKQALLVRLPPLLQLSCHGSAREVYTGKAQVSTSAYELASAMDDMRGSRRFEAVLTIACNSAQAGTNAFGESGGWSVALHGKVDAVLGALYPVDDLLCSLFVLLLHRAWVRTGDLRAALAETRTRLRTGQWEQDTTGEADVFSMWCSALSSATGAAEPISSARLEVVLRRARDHYDHRSTLYMDDRRMRLVVESFVILG